MDHMNYSNLWNHNSWCYEQLKAMDGMNNLRVLMIWMILGHELKTLNVVNSLGQCMT